MVQWKEAFKGEEGLRQREERNRTAADEIDLFSEQKGQVTMTGGERGDALEYKTISRAGEQAVQMTAVLCLFSRHSA